jgi:hypothetical protein
VWYAIRHGRSSSAEINAAKSGILEIGLRESHFCAAIAQEIAQHDGGSQRPQDKIVNTILVILAGSPIEIETLERNCE